LCLDEAQLLTDDFPASGNLAAYFFFQAHHFSTILPKISRFTSTLREVSREYREFPANCINSQKLAALFSEHAAASRELAGNFALDRGLRLLRGSHYAKEKAHGCTVGLLVR
jgi:hypothetical protein